MSGILVYNAATCSATGLPASNCNCGSHAVRNADAAGADDVDKVRPLSRVAAKATVKTLPNGRDKPTEDHGKAATYAAKALVATNDGKTDKAAAAHGKAASLHDSMAHDALFAGDVSGHDQHARAADAHRKAASACGGMTQNARNGIYPADPWPVLNLEPSPRLQAALVENGLFTPEMVNADTFSGSSRQGAPSMAGSDRPHSFDQLPGVARSSADDDGIADQYDVTTGRQMNAKELLQSILAQTEGDRINARRQGLDVPDPGMEEYYNFPYGGSPSGQLVASQAYPVINVQDEFGGSFSAVPVDPNDPFLCNQNASQVVANERRAKMQQEFSGPVLNSLGWDGIAVENSSTTARPTTSSTTTIDPPAQGGQHYLGANAGGGRATVNNQEVPVENDFAPPAMNYREIASPGLLKKLEEMYGKK